MLLKCRPEMGTKQQETVAYSKNQNSEICIRNHNEC